MKITHYLYNSFVIESVNKKLAIDPGAMFFYFFRLTTAIPKTEWEDITHIFVTHGDIDHYWHTDRMAGVSGAPIICNATMVRAIQGEKLILGPRDKGLSFTTSIKRLRTISVDETIHNTMDEDEALQAVDIMKPKLVIPCHYNCPAFFSRKYNPADAKMFQREVEKMGSRCRILDQGDSIVI
jgi:L-ascorbate metabolism protein UlaG (beta-lactamase superfamily)